LKTHRRQTRDVVKYFAEIGMKIALGNAVVRRDGRKGMGADGRLPTDASGAQIFLASLEK
jgi:hypothetical protein